MKYKLDKNINIFHHPNTATIPVRYLNNQNIPFHEYIEQTCPSLFSSKAKFIPSPFLRSGHLQTMYASVYKGTSTICDITYERQMLKFKNGGVASLDWVIPLSPLPDNTPTLVILHGLTGGSHETYIRGLLQAICRPPINYRAVVYNARGCGFTNIETPQLFNAAITDDLREALAIIQDQIGKSTPLIGIGFSLGSNILVKYLGEEGEKTPFIAAISVGNPFDLISSGHYLDSNYFTKTLYSQSMGTNLKRIFSRNMEIIEAERKDIDVTQVLAAKTIREYDDAYTKKMFNYSTVDNYYRDASCCRVIEHVRIPLLCINALDDPISSLPCIPFDEIMINPYVVLALTQYGGHLGWFEHAYRPSRWVDKPLAEYIVAMFQAYDQRPDIKPLDTQVAARCVTATRKKNPYINDQLMAKFEKVNPITLFFVLVFSWFVFFFQ